MPDHATPPWLYLASQSPRRRQLLDQLGVSHRLLLPDAHEDADVLDGLDGALHRHARPQLLQRLLVRRFAVGVGIVAHERLILCGIVGNGVDAV